MTNPAQNARRALATMLAVLNVAPFASAQTTDADALRRLQEENAALRKQLAEFQAKGPTTPAIPPAPAPKPAATTPKLTTDEGLVALTPFEVNTDRDYGYLRTNAATATKIGMEIQKIPMNLSVVSREFLDDTNARNLTDLFRYTAAASGDTRFAMRVAVTELVLR